DASRRVASGEAVGHIRRFPHRVHPRAARLRIRAHPHQPETAMPTPTDIIQAAYAAFGRGDIPALLELLDDDIEWTFHGSIGLAYMGTVRGKAAVARWFGHVAELDDIQAFEPRQL